MIHPPFELLAELEDLRKSRAIVYCMSERSPKLLTNTDLTAFFRVMQEVPPAKSLALVLHSEGGAIGATRGLALQLREIAPRLEILVADKARSAGTLLCLAADELILGPAVEFSPIDPHIRSDRKASDKLPQKISSEDIRAFRAMAESWFDLRSEESRIEIFKLLNQRFFPATLGAFFRADRYARKIGRELLHYQLPGASDAEREAIVDRLVTGYPNHEEPIGRRDIMRLGLRARDASGDESRILNRIMVGCQEYMDAGTRGPRGQSRSIRALFFSQRSGMEFIARAPDSGDGEAPDSAEENDQRRRGRWSEIQITG